jgi:hypothetical protein
VLARGMGCCQAGGGLQTYLRPRKEARASPTVDMLGPRGAEVSDGVHEGKRASELNQCWVEKALMNRRAI